ncbi:YceI family protein [Flavobacterium agrisoli]|uniref:YceI family protein n=1 Tax=Flavobacterium agrisoli TaxID=2793066 RepID=A0A934UL41_9FLAO|nr:YceI family protein [Flavobacterium agrisoli]MBK0371223.1 YceI family protein [Flavobacterium agrisoli]
MKKTTLWMLLLISQIAVTQNKMITTGGQISFEASVPYSEPIKAENNKVKVTFDTRSQILECVALVEDYDFELGLMKKHFRENYLESGRYPKAVFRGKIEKFDLKKITEIPKEHTITGKMQLHGKTKNISVKAIIKRTADGISIHSNFVLNPGDFEIEIPNMLSDKVAKNVTTNLIATLQ